MKTFLMVYIVLSSIGVILRAIVMAWVPYPRTVKYSTGEDLFILLTGIGMLVWALFLYLNN